MVSPGHSRKIEYLDLAWRDSTISTSEPANVAGTYGKIYASYFELVHAIYRKVIKVGKDRSDFPLLLK